MPRKKKAEVEPASVATPVEPALPGDAPAPVEPALPGDAPAPVEPAPVEPVLVTPAPAAPAPMTPTPAAPAGPSLEERRLAAVAHGSTLLNLISGGIFGPLVALVLWLLYDRKSEYISWHALQALVFQVLSLLLFLVLGGITAALWAITGVLLQVVVGFCLVPIALGCTAITAAVGVGGLVYGCAGALSVLDGRDFRYRWVADWIPPLNRP